MRMAGRFSRRVRAWAGAQGVPVIDCKRGERKHQLAEEYLASHPVGTGVFASAIVLTYDPDRYTGHPIDVVDLRP
jgi:hypothetical protein